MKKLLTLSLIFALIMLAASPALAAGPCDNKGPARRGIFALVGTITALDTTAMTVTVQVSSGNRLVKPYIGTALTISTDQATRFLLRNPDGEATPITFADLSVGQHISSRGRVVESAWKALRITVNECQCSNK